jgi:hypothetical protein
MSGKLPAVLGIGLGTLLALGILFAVGWLLLRKYLAPAPPTTVLPAGTPPWLRSQDQNMMGNTMMMNGGGFAQQGAFDSPFPPGNGGFGPAPDMSPFGPGDGGFGPPPQSPFGPSGPGDGAFAPVGGGFGPPPQSPFGPSGPGDGGYAPAGSFGPPQQMPFDGPTAAAGTQPMPLNDPFQPVNGGFAPSGVAQEPFQPNDWFAQRN